MAVQLDYGFLASYSSGSWTYSALASVVVIAILTAAVKRYQYVRRINTIPGPFGGLTVLGNAIDVRNKVPLLNKKYILIIYIICLDPIVIT